MAPTGKAEYIIEDVAGCGMFQVLLCLFSATLIKTTLAFSVMFMAYGNYNPGWRCMDNITDSIPANDSRFQTAATEAAEAVSDEYLVGSCEDYNKCGDVEFNPESSTVLTEWGLVCDSSWIISLIISIQMLGMLVGSYIGGQLSDIVGRKITLYIGVAVCGISQLISSFSVSWPMFLVLRFFLGTFTTSNLVMIMVYLSEYMTTKWRAIMLGFPFWYLGASLLAIVSWICKDWRQVELAGFAMGVLSFLPMFWVPESLRWLGVKNKTRQFIKVSQKIAKLNKKVLPPFEEWNFTENITESTTNRTYTGRDMFRKGYRLITICLTFLLFSFSLLYYAISFGAKSFYGDFYFNLLISNMIPIPFSMCAMLAMRYVTRRMHTVLFLGLTTFCAIVSVGILLSDNELARSFGSTILISLSRGTLAAAWYGVYARAAESYPTVIRGTSVGVVNLSARAGGILAPFLIPNDQSVLYIFMIVMAVGIMICILVSLKLPETKGKPLKDTFEDDEVDNVEMSSPIKA